MEVTRIELRERFRAMSDEELLKRVLSGDLTPEALQVATVVLESRGVKIPEQPVEESQAGQLHDVPLVTVAEFWNLAEAHVLRACLESQGVYAYVWGEHFGAANPYFSVISGGGFRVQVRAEELATAQEILAALKRGDLALDEDPR